MKFEDERVREREHQRFLDRYYGWTRYVYDATRRYYLLGRDRALESLLAEASSWDSLIEVGPGTGRNLRILHRARPQARYGGVEASTAMLEHAKARCPLARLEEGFAERADLAGLLGRRPDRILFSYSLSMIEDPAAALRNAVSALAPGGQVVVVDFGSLSGVPAQLRGGFERWLSTFHVRTGGLLNALSHAERYEVGPLGLYEIARIEARPQHVPDIAA